MKKIKINCKYCGSSFFVYPRKLKIRTNLFCSVQCSGRWAAYNLKPFKGHRHTEEWKRRNGIMASNSLKGRIGKKMTSEQIEKTRLVTLNQGKNESYRNKVINGLKKTFSNKKYHRIFSENTKKQWNDSNRRKRHLERLRSRQLKFFNTDIELKLEELLNLLSIRYEKQPRVQEICLADFYLPDSNLYIFCDGDYWHNLPDVFERDKRNNLLMSERGIKFIRFSGKEILNNKERVIKNLLSSLS